MRTPARLLVIFLGLTTATSVFYAYQQQKSLQAARLVAESLERERADLRERLRRAERETFAASTATEAATNGATVQANRPEGEPAMELPSPAEIAASGLGRLPQLLENPEAQRLMAMQQRSALDQRYGALFRYLNLPPAQLERLKDLLVERQTAAMDVLAAARSQGLNNRENRGEIRSLLEAAQSEVDDGIRALLGESDYQRYQYYNSTQPQRAAVGRLEQRLSYSPLPLTSTQSEQLVQLLANQPSSNSSRVPARPGLAGMFGGQAAVISDEAVTQAATILSPVQLEALRQLQAEQQAQARLGQLVRETRGGRNTTPNPGTPPRG
jgi:hypothetical protein